MPDSKLKAEQMRVDMKELEFPETFFIRDIENKVFLSIALQCLSQIEGISLVEGNFIDHLLGRIAEGVKGIHAEQDEKKQTVSIKVEVNLHYGIAIPDKAEQIQTKIVQEITKLTGLHVSSVHVVVKNIIPAEQTTKSLSSSSLPLVRTHLNDEYSDEF